MFYANTRGFLSCLAIWFESCRLIMFIQYTLSYNLMPFLNIFIYFYYKHQILRDLYKLKKEITPKNPIIL